MIRLHRARRADHEQEPERPSRETWLRLALAVFTWAALCLILLGYNLFPGRVALRVGEISPKLIRAPRMARYVDLEETERLRRQAEQRVPPQYKPLPYAIADADTHPHAHAHPPSSDAGRCISPDARAYLDVSPH